MIDGGIVWEGPICTLEVMIQRILRIMAGAEARRLEPWRPREARSANAQGT